MKLRLGLLTALVLLGLAAPQAAAADDYPKRQIKIIMPFPVPEADVLTALSAFEAALRSNDVRHSSRVQ